MTNYNERLYEVLDNVLIGMYCTNPDGDFVPLDDRNNVLRAEAKQALTSLIKELVAEAIGEDESLVEVHKRNLVVASQFNAVVKSRNSLRHKQRQALKNLLKALEEV